MSTVNATATDFWSKFEERTAKYDLLQHAFYKAWTEGTLTSEDLREYAAEYWHHVAAFPTYLSALHAGLPDGELRRRVLENLADEEGVESVAARAHSDLWMDFARGMGADETEVRERELNAETSALIATFRALMKEAPASAMAALYAYEARVPAIAKEKAVGLACHYGADAATCRYFTLHEKADVHHARVWQREMDALLAGGADEEAALDAAERAAKALWETLDGIERERLLRGGRK
jgi:pyrroloquinoline-quinone synthase